MRFRTGVVVGLLGLGAVAIGCSGNDEPFETETLDTTSQALGTPVTVTFQDGVSAYAGTTDTQIVQTSPTTSYGSTASLNFDGDTSGGSDSYALFRWDIASIPSNATVQAVSISLRVTNTGATAYPIYALKRSWAEGTASWNNASTGVPWQTAGAQGANDRESTSLGNILASSTGTLTFTLNASAIAKVQSWVNGTATNYGFVIASPSVTDGVDVASRENTTATFRPKLSVTYALPGDPPTGSVLLAVGDVGNCNATGDTATGNLLDTLAGPIILAGDVAYPNGAAADFTNCFAPPWGRHKSRISPVPGNHEYVTANATPYYNYFGAAAGDPTKGYYSYNYAGWHVVALNSNCPNITGGCAAGGAQEQWLRQDLAASSAACTIAFMHHPRYSSGSHGDSTSVAPLWQALVDFQADIVISGHDHDYERFNPMDANGNANANAIRSWVVGTGGTGLTALGMPKPNSAVRNSTTYGVLQLTLNASDYAWQFVTASGGPFSDSGTASCH